MLYKIIILNKTQWQAITKSPTTDTNTSETRKTSVFHALLDSQVNEVNSTLDFDKQHRGELLSQKARVLL